MNRIRPFYDKNIIKVIIGLRRSGKSKLLELVMDEIKESITDEAHIVYLNFDDLDNLDLYDYINLNKYLKSKIKDKKKYFIFLDEIQNVDNFEKTIESLYSTQNVSIFITGSNSKLLSSDLATLLTGRYVEFEMLPFSFSEFVDYKSKLNQNIDIDKEFENYMKWGGLPMSLEYDEEDSIITYIKSLYKSIIEKDILHRYAIKNKKLLYSIAKYILMNPGRIISIDNICNYYKSSNNEKIARGTVYNYLKYLENAFLIEPIIRYDISGKRVLKNVDKYYSVDQGFTRTLNEDKTQDIGLTLENIIYNEYLQRGYEVYVGKTYKGEVDFIVSKSNEKFFIQVAYLLSDKKIIEREFGAFAAIRENYPKMVMSLDKLDFSRDGIKHINIIDFLINSKIENFL